jgi:hypothetical protein
MSAITSYNPTYGFMCISNVILEQPKYKEECLQLIKSMNFGDINTITYLPYKKSKETNSYNIYVKYSNLNENNKVLKKFNEENNNKKFNLSINHDFKFNKDTKKYWIATFKNRNTFDVDSEIWNSLISYYTLEDLKRRFLSIAI